MESPPQYQQPPLTQAFTQTQQKAEEADIAAIQERLKGDTASLLMRFGQQQALATSISAPNETPVDQIFGRSGPLAYAMGSPGSPLLRL